MILPLKSQDLLTSAKIPEVLCISVFGKIPDVSKTVTSDFKKPGSVIVLVGKTDLKSMCGSVYLDSLSNKTIEQSNNIPHVDLNLLPKTLDAVYRGIQSGKLLSCHDISEGGLITTIFEMCVGGNVGATMHLGWWRGNDLDSSEVKRPDYFLFNETAGCFITEVENEKIARKLFKNIPYSILGQTEKEENITVKQKNKILFKEKVEVLKKSWQEPMREIFI